MKIFQLSSDATMQALEETGYRNQAVGGFGEATLQSILVDHPEILPAEDMDPSDPPKFLVVQSEAGVTAGSMDILLIDHRGVPTVVETKLVDNREIRRSVLAQGVEYVAHLKAEWTGPSILSAARDFWGSKGGRLEDAALERLGIEINEGFVEQIDGHLRSNRMRLLIVSDEIPAELRRVIEFLNEASEFDVFGVEVRLFAKGSGKRKLLAPKLVGSSQRNIDRKGTTTGEKWTEERFFQALEKNVGTAGIATARELMAFGRSATAREVEWGNGKERGSFTARLIIGKERFSLFSVYTTGEVSVNFGWNKDRLSLLGEGTSERFRAHVASEIGENFEQNAWVNGWPMMDLEPFSADKMKAFKSVINSFVDEAKRAGTASD